MIEWLGPVPPGNFMPGRNGMQIRMIVDHWVGIGSFADAAAWFRNPASGVSAHYLIRADGVFGQLVHDENTAYHAGDWAVNIKSIGIEHETTPDLAPTDALYQASADLHRMLAEKYGFPLIVGQTVKPHRAIVPTQCPGTLDLDRIVREATMSVTQQEFEEYKRALQAQLEAVNAQLAATERARIAAALRKAADELDNV